MAKKPSLKDIKILLADSDGNLGVVLTDVLMRMGFKGIQFVRDGASAIKALEAEKKDILITEWELQSVDGIALTSFIRNSSDPAIRLLPVIMLTARAEKQDVEAARDAGITEFVVKPYSSRTVFQRIQQVIENPRGFLVASQYIGPDRRRRDGEGPAEERRVEPPVIIIDRRAATVVDARPKLILPDHMLKKMIGDEPLENIITPQVLDKAQAVIDDLKDTSLTWIRQHLGALDRQFAQLGENGGGAAMEKIKESLLAIKSQTGTFGYTAACGVAQQLYHFMRFSFAPGDEQHIQLVLKHIQSLKLLLSSGAHGTHHEKEGQLIAGLKTLVGKLQRHL